MPDLRSQLEALRAKLARQSNPAPPKTGTVTLAPRTQPDTVVPPLIRDRDQRPHPALDFRSRETRPQTAAMTRVSVASAAATRRSGQDDNSPRLDVVIGLDFGTRFTKVGYRIV